LDVNGDIHANNIWIPGWYWCLFGGAWYSIDKSGSTAFWDQSSDQRLKRDITTIPDAVGALKQLRGVTFHWNEVGLQHLTRDIEKKWKSTSGKPEDDQKLWAEKRKESYAKLAQTQVGFVAQEVEKVFPDWVTTDEKGFKQINMQHLDAVLVNAVREQQDQIEAQQQQITTLQSANQSLEKRLAAIESALNQLPPVPSSRR
jgi:hypothetical protein